MGSSINVTKYKDNKCCTQSNNQVTSTVILVIHLVAVFVVGMGVVTWFWLTWEVEVTKYNIFNLIKYFFDFSMFILSIILCTSGRFIIKKRFSKGIAWGIVFILLNTILCALLIGFGVYFTSVGSKWLWESQYGERREVVDAEYIQLTIKIYRIYLIWGVFFIIGGVVSFILDISVIVLVILSVGKLKEKHSQIAISEELEDDFDLKNEIEKSQGIEPDGNIVIKAVEFSSDENSDKESSQTDSYSSDSYDSSDDEEDY